MDLISFGIEFETCFCHKGLDIEDEYLERYSEKLQEIAGSSNTFIYSYDPNEHTDYTAWVATIDLSIECQNKDEFDIVSDVIYTYKDELTECIYHPVELVSPIISLSSEYEKFKTTLNDVILNPVFQYQSNESQGMHVNVSHPRQDKLCMLKLWWYFEPVILQFIPNIRRNNDFIKTVRSVFKNIEDIESRWVEYYALPNIPPAKYTTLCVKENRFEFRLVNADMNADHIKAWIGLCSNLVYLSSINTQIPTEGSDDLITLFEQLFSEPYVNDLSLKAYFEDRLFIYKFEEYNLVYKLSKILDTQIKIDLDTYHLFKKYGLMDFDLIFIRILTVDKDPVLLNNFLIKYKIELKLSAIINNFLLIQQNKELFRTCYFSAYYIDTLLKIILNYGIDDGIDNNTLSILYEYSLSSIHMFNFLLKINPYGFNRFSNALIEGFKRKGTPVEKKFHKEICFQNIILIKKAADLLPQEQKQQIINTFVDGNENWKIARQYLILGV
jgi:hypothetical protein